MYIKRIEAGSYRVYFEKHFPGHLEYHYIGNIQRVYLNTKGAKWRVRLKNLNKWRTTYHSNFKLAKQFVLNKNIKNK